jgi:regulator of protease activity HflC (stomatin/prohibitin superfamily)
MKGDFNEFASESSKVIDKGCDFIMISFKYQRKYMDTQLSHDEITVNASNGWAMLFCNLAIFVLGIFLLIAGISNALPAEIGVGILALILSIVFMKGLFTLQPNEACILILMGKYKGTVRDSGFFWTNPFYSQTKISLRSRNLNSDKLKVNDKRGNPIEIAAVIVWKVENTARASFDVVDYMNYIHIQSESAIRHLANSYAYDEGDGGEPTLRGGGELVVHTLQEELQQRLNKAGILIEEARLTHLAYAPEIAQVMLRRQQAEAVIAARQKIVHGAVSMVEMALNELATKKVVHLDDERKAAMVSNLLVILCGESEATPVINTGTLYN